MKKILIILCLLSLSGCTNSDDVKFSIDPYNLSYALPDHEMICIPKTKEVCAADGCEKVKPTVFLLYGENTLMRCDEKYCDFYGAKKYNSGVFTIIEADSADLFVKMIESEIGKEIMPELYGQYTESTHSGLSTHVSYGECDFKN